MNKLVSVIVPIYNAECFIQKCLDSCIRQTYSDIEIICVNDGSVDRSADILDNYTRIDERIRVIHKKNGGVTSARMAGLAQASADFVSFVDVDDYLHADAIKILIEQQIDSNGDIVMGQSTSNYIELQQIPGDGGKIIFLGLDFLRNILVHGGALRGGLIRKSLFSAVNIPGSIKWGEDYATLVQLAAQVSKVVVIQSCIYCYADNPLSVTSQKKLDVFLTWRDAKICVKNYLEKRGALSYVYREMCCCELRWELTALRVAVGIGYRQTELWPLVWRYLVLSPCVGFFCLRNLRGSIRICLIIALVSPLLAAWCLRFYGNLRMKTLKHV